MRTPVPRLLFSLAFSCVLCMGAASALASPELSTAGGHFRDAAGRVVILRGVNVSGSSKVPPFLPFTDLSKADQTFDQLSGWGYNVIRLLWNWEAYEPSPGTYDDTYLRAMVDVADAAWKRGIFTIVDVHQDGFSRYQLSGCGDGFPEWAIPAGIPHQTPDNSAASCASWGTKMFSDPDMLACFTGFYADQGGVRTRYLTMLGRIAAAFKTVPGVVGYDPINEPWGKEDTEILPLYEDAAASVRAVDPTAILFLEGHVLTNTGLQSALPRPSFSNFAYAPHFYDSLAMALGAWNGLSAQTDLAFKAMRDKAAGWGVPLLLGEFGLAVPSGRSGAYVDLVYDRLNDALASATYWNVTPGWSAAKKDGWNGEDFSLVDDLGATRATFRDRPFPRRIPGTPQRIVVQPPRGLSAGSIEIAWKHEPALGQLEAYVPVRAVWGTTPVKIETSAGLSCALTGDRSLVCDSAAAGDKRVKVRACVTVLGACL